MLYLAGQQLLPGRRLFALRYVASDFGGTDHFAVCVYYRRDAERDVNGASVFALPDSLVVLDALPAPDPVEDTWLLIMTTSGDECRDRFADHLLRAVAKQSLGSAVPAR